MTVYVLSKMAGAVSYNFYEQHNKSANRNDASGEIPHIRKSVVIHGGAGIPSLTSGLGERTKTDDGHILYTAAGAVTPISDADYEELKNHFIFQKHIEGGMIKIVNRDITGNHNAIAKEAASMSEDPLGLMTKDKLKQKIKVSSKLMKQEDDFRM